MFIDSHCHLQFFNFDTLGIEESDLILEAKEHKVEHMLCAGTHLDQYQKLQELCSKYNNVDISIGIHPTEEIDIEPSVEDYSVYMSDPKVVAIGETGLDYYRLQGDTDIQKTRFRTQIKSALAYNKPLIIHSRDAKEDTLSILKEEKAEQVGGVLHCFTGDLDFAKKALDLNFAISISGIVTFNKAQNIKEIASWLPLNQILIETDAPYLSPVPYRGKINRPSYIKYIAEYIATLRNISVEELAFHIKQNYFRIFKRG